MQFKKLSLCLLLGLIFFSIARDVGLDEMDFSKPRHRSSYSMGHEFGRAVSLVALLSLSNELTEIFDKDKTQIFKALFVVASCTFLVDLSLMAVQLLNKRGPKWCSSIWYRVRTWISRYMGLPPAFDPDHLLRWERLFVQTMSTLCEQLDLDVNQLREPEAQLLGVGWNFYRTRVDELLDYMVQYYTGHEHYYRAHRQRVKAQGVRLIGYVGNEADHICFMIKLLAADLQHIRLCLQGLENMRALDQAHMKRMMQSSLAIMRHLREIINGEGGEIQASEIVSGATHYNGLFNEGYR